MDDSTVYESAQRIKIEAYAKLVLTLLMIKLRRLSFYDYHGSKSAKELHEVDETFLLEFQAVKCYRN